MNTFGKDMTVLCGLFSQLILLSNIWPASIDDYFAADFKFLSVSAIKKFSLPFVLLIQDAPHRFHVIDRYTVAIDRRTNKIKDKS